MTDGKQKNLAYGLTKKVATRLLDNNLNYLKTADRSEHIIRNSILNGVGLSLGLLVTGALFLLETPIVPFEIIGDGVNRLRRK